MAIRRNQRGRDGKGDRGRDNTSVTRGVTPQWALQQGGRASLRKQPQQFVTIFVYCIEKKGGGGGQYYIQREE